MCKHVCGHVCSRACRHVCRRVCKQVCRHAFVRVDMHVDKCIDICADMCVDMRIDRCYLPTPQPEQYHQLYYLVVPQARFAPSPDPTSRCQTTSKPKQYQTAQHCLRIMRDPVAIASTLAIPRQTPSRTFSALSGYKQKQNKIAQERNPSPRHCLHSTPDPVVRSRASFRSPVNAARSSYVLSGHKQDKPRSHTNAVTRDPVARAPACRSWETFRLVCFAPQTFCFACSGPCRPANGFRKRCRSL